MRTLRATSASVRSLVLIVPLSAWIAGCSTSSEAASPARPNSIPAGTQIVARTTSTLSTQFTSEGTVFSAVLDSPLRLAGRIAIPAGARIDGVIAPAGPEGQSKGRPSIGIKLTTIHLGDGRTIPVSTTTHWRSAPDRSLNDPFTAGALSGEAVILSGSPIAFRLVEPLVLPQ
jgi:hypothetical protein